MKQPVYASTVERTIERINAEKLDWLPHPGNESLYLRADCDGIWMCHAADDSRIVKQADSWISAPRVSLAKPEAPVCVAHLVADVPQESNAVVMARTLAVVRANRITREYVAASAADSILSGVLAIAPREVVTALAMADEDARLAAEYLAVKDGEKCVCEVGPEWSGSPHPDAPDTAWECDDCGRRIEAECEQERALAAEQARADAARKLAGVAFCARLAHEAGEQVARDIDEDDDNPSGFTNHYVCPECAHEWTDEWSCMVDDDCPECGARHISPFMSEDA